MQHFRFNLNIQKQNLDRYFSMLQTFQNAKHTTRMQLNYSKFSRALYTWQR